MTSSFQLFSSSLPTEPIRDYNPNEYEQLLCMICSEPAYTPVLCQNVEHPHLFCAGCVEQYVKINGPRTIRCFIDSESPYVDTLLMSLPESNRREYMVILEDDKKQLTVELTNCPIPTSDYITFIKCPICRLECTQFALASRKMAQLNHRTVWCHGCTSPMGWDQLTDHQNQCCTTAVFSFATPKRKLVEEEEEEEDRDGASADKKKTL